MIYIFYTILGAAICAVAQALGMAATRHLHPFKVCALRFGLGAPVCYAFSVAYTRTWIPDLTPTQYLLAAVVGVSSWGIGAMMFFTAMQKGGMYRVGPVSNSLGIWTVILSVIFLGEKFFGALAVVMILLGAGVFLIAPASAKADKWKPAIPMALAVSVIWAAGIVLTKVAVRGVPYPTFVCIKMVAATVFLLFFYPFTGTKMNGKGFLLGLGSAFTLVFGDTLLMAGIDALPASLFSPLFATTIPFGFLFSIVFLKEKPLVRNWIGMLLIFAAAAICGYYSAMK
jgi:drug/metabolite transporter (DMT)-like permease